MAEKNALTSEDGESQYKLPPPLKDTEAISNLGIDPKDLKKEDGEVKGMSEEELIKSLKAMGNYIIIPKQRDGSRTSPAVAPKPRVSILSPVEEDAYTRPRTSSIAAGDHSFSEASFYSRPQQTPKPPLFSGENPPLKGDVLYSDWRYEIRCLMSDQELSQSTVVQAIRRSLRGVARRTLVHLGEKATPQEILTKLDALFGDIATHGMIMQEFFNSKQKPDEPATNFGCRLEQVLQIAIENGSLPKSAKNDLLRHKFWTSLHSDKLKSQTRHKYDTLTDYDSLLREIRTVESELELANNTTQKKKGQHQAVSVEVDQLSVGDISKDFDKKLKLLEEKANQRLVNNQMAKRMCWIGY
ncbi:uncharacterized protein LOC110460701 [Mizuhopecten yessoensis]|uniref:uncharacterized protein LOC110446709 n=1 Tax=Mizuhopecten yessoensis TaxID=6573 RepID=UPI000B45C604|nr:uncharacterized protein LOC110446709 [Mizuhopecten yessoensis]XP_021348917.1 uncharacterized protein LOC110447503 [Mizuhopecten yessoensis]XP_021351854.1 uncharacterized protein LOC110449361 [Mizuhopecten yessoensis]XP_021369432.1 uncharacterized protein LOC110460701 [Mizuhopecten yessoensis]